MTRITPFQNMNFQEPTTEPEQAMASSPHESAVALSSPPTPSFDSSPAGRSPSLSARTDSPDPFHQSRDPEYLASSLLRVLDEREEEFHYRYGQVMEPWECLKRDTNKMEEAIKFKRDDLVMMENLIKLKEIDVENLEALVSAAQAGEDAPTSPSLRPFSTLSSTSNASSSVSDRRIPTSPVSNVFPSVQSGERKVSRLPLRRINNYLGEGGYWETVPGRGRREKV